MSADLTASGVVMLRSARRLHFAVPGCPGRVALRLPRLHVVILLALCLCPVQMRAGTEQSHPHSIFQLLRSGVRLPVVAISAFIDAGIVVNDEYRNTSLIRTLRERWPLGGPLTERDEEFFNRLERL